MHAHSHTGMNACAGVGMAYIHRPTPTPICSYDYQINIFHLGPNLLVPDTSSWSLHPHSQTDLKSGFSLEKNKQQKKTCSQTFHSRCCLTARYRFSCSGSIMERDRAACRCMCTVVNVNSLAQKVVSLLQVVLSFSLCLSLRQRDTS